MDKKDYFVHFHNCTDNFFSHESYTQAELEVLKATSASLKTICNSCCSLCLDIYDASTYMVEVLINPAYGDDISDEQMNAMSEAEFDAYWVGEAANRVLKPYGEGISFEDVKNSTGKNTPIV